MTVHDPHTLGLRQRRGIQKLIDALAGFFGAVADEIDLANGSRKPGLG